MDRGSQAWCSDLSDSARVEVARDPARSIGEAPDPRGVEVMRHRLLFLLVLVVVSVGSLTANAAAATRAKPHMLRAPSPSWLTPALRESIVSQAPKPRDMPEDLVFKSCPGTG